MTTTIDRSLASPVDLRKYIPSAEGGPFAGLLDLAPWEITSNAEAIVKKALKSLSGYVIEDSVAIHRKAIVERGAVLKPPVIVRPGAFVAAGAYLRGGVFIDDDCIVGPNCELKSTFMLTASKIAHLSFIGDSILGSGVNIEAGAVIANYRNELDDKQIRIMRNGDAIETGVEKFGALIGDGARIGANAVISPGAIIGCGEIVKRLSLVDQAPV